MSNSTVDDGGLASWQLDFRGEYSWVEDVRKTNQMLLKIWHDLATKAADSAGGRNPSSSISTPQKATVGKLVNGYLFYYQTENKGVGIAVCRGDHEYVLASKTASRFILPLESGRNRRRQAAMMRTISGLRRKKRTTDGKTAGRCLILNHMKWCG